MFFGTHQDQKIANPTGKALLDASGRVACAFSLCLAQSFRQSALRLLFRFKFAISAIAAAETKSYFSSHILTVCIARRNNEAWLEMCLAIFVNAR
jgi:hypothetical protein